MQGLHMTKLRTDAGSEWAGDFTVWITAQAAADRNFYSHSKTSGSRASGNSIAERAISSVRRPIAAHFRSIEAQWDAANTLPRNRRYNWTDYLQEYENRYNNRKHSTIRARPIDAIQRIPADREQQMRIIVKAVRRYGTRAVDRYQPTKNSRATQVPAVGDLVRNQKWKTGQPGRAVLDARKTNKASDGGNYSDQIFRVTSVNAARGLKQSTYIISDLTGNEQRGNWTRQQLLHIPPSTMNYISDSSSSDSSGDEDEQDNEDDYRDAATVNTRPPKPGQHRYKRGDRLFFKADFFRVQPGGLGALSNVLRDREGTVATLQRQRARGVNRGAYLYAIEFEGNPRNQIIRIDRLPAHGPPDDPGVDDDENVEFISEQL